MKPIPRLLLTRSYMHSLQCVSKIWLHVLCSLILICTAHNVTSVMISALRVWDTIVDATGRLLPSLQVTKSSHFILVEITRSRKFLFNKKEKKLVEVFLQRQILGLHHKEPLITSTFNLFPHNDTFWRPWETSLLKTLWEKEKLLVTSNFSFSHSVFYPFG